MRSSCSPSQPCSGASMIRPGMRCHCPLDGSDNRLFSNVFSGSEYRNDPPVGSKSARAVCRCPQYFGDLHACAHFILLWCCICCPPHSPPDPLLPIRRCSCPAREYYPCSGWVVMAIQDRVVFGYRSHPLIFSHYYCILPVWVHSHPKGAVVHLKDSEGKYGGNPFLNSLYINQS